MHIHQPRRGHYDSWTLSAINLNVKRVEVAGAAKQALASGVEGIRRAGDWCKFCKAATDCTTRARWVGEAVFSDTTAIFKPEHQVVRMPDYKMLAIYRGRTGAIRDWCNAVDAAAEVALSRGEEVKGWKLVAGKETNRTWADENLARAELSGILQASQLNTEPVLKSPAQIEKLLHKEQRPIVKSLTIRSPGRPAVVAESDPRPPYSVPSAEGFNQVIEI